MIIILCLNTTASKVWCKGIYALECSYLGIQATGPDYWAGILDFPLTYKLHLAIQRAIDDEQF